VDVIEPLRLMGFRKARGFDGTTEPRHPLSGLFSLADRKGAAKSLNKMRCDCGEYRQAARSYCVSRDARGRRGFGRVINWRRRASILKSGQMLTAMLLKAIHNFIVDGYGSSWFNVCRSSQAMLLS
jgi:hypothetical protein